MVDGFGYDFVGDTMQEDLEATVFFALDTNYRVMGGPSPALLEVAMPFLVLSFPVVELVCRPEPSGRSDRELIHTEDCSVPGGGVGVVVLFFEHRRMEIPVTVTSMQSSPPKLVLLVGTYFVGGVSASSGRMYLHSIRPSTVDNETWSQWKVALRLS